MTGPLGALAQSQRELLVSWLPDLEVVADHSWGLVETRVLEIISQGKRHIVKAGGPSDGHLAREIRAHQEWVEPWVRTGHAARLVHADVDAKLVVTEYLPGVLVESTSAQDDPEVYRQAGALIVHFHRQLCVLDADWHDRFRGRIERFLDQPHRIDPEVERRVRDEVATWPGGSACVVPTHGDWQPRNWLLHDGEVRVIDFGRADLRPVEEDFVRLARQDFARDPAFEAAYLEGYGSDPREPGSWRRALVGEAVGTAVWAYRVGDEGFEKFGHTLLAQLFKASRG